MDLSKLFEKLTMMALMPRTPPRQSEVNPRYDTVLRNLTEEEACIDASMSALKYEERRAQLDFDEGPEKGPEHDRLEKAVMEAHSYSELLGNIFWFLVRANTENGFNIECIGIRKGGVVVSVDQEKQMETELSKATKIGKLLSALGRRDIASEN